MGAIYTPPEFAHFLSSWAVRKPEQKILDVGVGEGIFVFSAYRRLLELGVKPDDARQQVYGAEVDSSAYAKFLESAKSLDSTFPHVHHADFFQMGWPQVEAIVGNPPYVRRTYIEEVDDVRQRVLDNNPILSEIGLPRLSDLYVYFLLHALPSLKPGGRLAVITADPWINTEYGAVLRKYLQQHFVVERLISLDRRVFENAQVKPVLLLAVKQMPTLSSQTTDFVRVRNGLPISRVQELLSSQDTNIPDISVHRVNLSELPLARPWSVYFKIPEVYEKLSSHRLMTPLSDIANTRIGIQTLAKDFFVLSARKAKEHNIEPEFLKPLAQSSRYLSEPIIEDSGKCEYYIFYCSKNRDEIEGTYALQYIETGETTTVPVRGKGVSVVGYQNKERIQQSNRKHWYDLRTALERRGRAEILIPRLMYRKATVIWNKAGYVPGELFIECLPVPHSGTNVEVYLAILSSSCTELLLRAHAQIYGGGTYNLNPGQIKKVPILNVALLTEKQKRILKETYLQYLKDDDHDRSLIDSVVYEILDLDTDIRSQIQGALADLVGLATASKNGVSTGG